MCDSHLKLEFRGGKKKHYKKAMNVVLCCVIYSDPKQAEIVI